MTVSNVLRLSRSAGTLAGPGDGEQLMTRLEQEHAARVQAEKDLANARTLLRETTQQLAKQRLTLTWKLGEAVIRARNMADYLLLPYTLLRLSHTHRREHRHNPAPRKPNAAALPAEAASAIKDALDYVKRVRSPEVLLWCGQQSWPTEVRSKVYCEIARWARTSYPDIAEQVAQQLLLIDPAAPHSRQLAFSLFDAGLVTVPARLLQTASASGVRLNTAESQRYARIQAAHDVLTDDTAAHLPGGYRYDFSAEGPLLILAPHSLLQRRSANENALHRYATSLAAREGEVRVISWQSSDDDTADTDQPSTSELRVDGVLYQAVTAAQARTARLQPQALADIVLAQTVGQRPRAVLAWDDAHCGIAAHTAATRLRVPYGFIAHSVSFFQKTASNHVLSERALVDLRLLKRALSQADMLALGCTALAAPLQELLQAEPAVCLLPPFPLPAANLRTPQSDIALAGTLARLSGKKVIVWNEDDPPAMLARVVIDLYAELALHDDSAVLLVLSEGRTAAAMRQHAVAIGLSEDQVIFAPTITDAVSREQLLRQVHIALFPYWPTRADHTAVPACAALLEAMSLGLCPAVGPIATYTDLVTDGENGVHIDLAAAPADSAARLQALLREALAREQYGRKARESVQRHMPWQAYEEAISTMLMQAATPEPANPARRAEPQLTGLRSR
ncbi:glycosyltransferase [Bordetella holmesii]|uniref:Glycosyltransferase, group 1 family protein n=2 Tax=Bordetella holmesii TaxID=35814 RepID=A0A158M2U4_9BORD|nr:glycosyltransferase [Bordetella holmesii]AIT28247.1 glycosyl transferases group 1 family protein [Bordetella holmesii 44057]EWM41033.1 glycosyl transferases group 1 family protein [Bordetella holmesii 35009]EWM43125.1 glycosyl transferases group 1 family protein [Bordetella holmesii 41130]EWM44925.1 glycosyl transferases group 1 family protein [Bordetella holmesii 70147]EXF88251.1 glycosyl transferases group 1 family protein [Bordetella holmesii 30539]